MPGLVLRRPPAIQTTLVYYSRLAPRAAGHPGAMRQSRAQSLADTFIVSFEYYHVSALAWYSSLRRHVCPALAGNFEVFINKEGLGRLVGPGLPCAGSLLLLSFYFI